jgi:tripartite-type tricarboxylate transporter receptor subunit TctC
MGKRLAALVLLVVTSALTGVSGGLAQQYPTRPISLVVPFPAGSTTDLDGRILAIDKKVRPSSHGHDIVAQLTQWGV